ncbi:signal peptide protein [Rhodopirellula maiorica SM1]|uniref:Signal peptide protein n=2 Tax=Novipirellula TaxID=2795426 RepID=M5S3H8_9BACT|nr:signal peptide protein [Rhodopirellula maiorica SM1]
MLAGVTFFLMFLWGWIGTNLPAMGSISIVFLTMPAFYAAGVGAILIGQEKETETMQWVSALPLNASDVVRSKIIVALGGLSVMWCAALLGVLVMEPLRSRSATAMFPEPIWLSLSFWIIHSVYLTLCGFYASWRSQSVFTGLIIALAMACIPYIVGQFTTWVYTELASTYATDRVTLTFTGFWSIVGIAVVAVMGTRAASRELGPADAPRLFPTSSSPNADRHEHTALNQYSPPKIQDRPSHPFRYSVATLVWQSVNYNRRLLTGLAIMVLVGIASIPISSSTLVYRDGADELGVIVVLLAGLSVCWLGVLAFHGDGSSAAMRFLADRGISPSQAWWGRHLVGFAIIATATVVYILLQRLIVSGIGAGNDSVNQNLAASSPMPSALALIMLLVTAYGVSQWISQVLRILAGTAFLAPLLSAVCVYWLGSCWITMGTPIWLLGLIIVIPLLATFVQMARHMDGPRTIGFLSTHTLAIIAVFGLPYLWCWYETRSFPSISAERYAEMKQLSEERGLPVKQAYSLHRLPTPYEVLTENQVTELPTAKVVEALESVGDRPEDWFAINGAKDSPLKADYAFITDSVATTELMQVRWLDSLHQPDESSVRSRENFVRWVDFVTSIAKRLRLNWRIQEQCYADHIEIALTRMLVHPETQRLWDEKAVVDAIMMLGDQTSRSQARRGAVLTSWHQFHNDPEMRRNHSLGGYEVSWLLESKPSLQVDWLTDPAANRISSELLQLIDAGERGESTLPYRRALAQLTLGQPTLQSDDNFEISPYSDSLQSTLYGDHLATQYGFPGCQWYAVWESEAKKLAERFRNANDSDVDAKQQGTSSDES